MSILKEKTIKVFNEEDLRVGTIVTWCYTKYGDSGELIDGPYQNGLVARCTEDSLHLTRPNTSQISIKLESILNDEIRIIGVRDYAV